MTSVDAVREALADWTEPRPHGEWVVVPTTCAYPSNRTVNVYLLGGSETVRAFDGGGAFDELDGCGEYGFNAFKVLKGFAKDKGISVDDRGWLMSEPVPYADLAGIVPHMANLSVSASSFLISRRHKKKLVDLREEVNKVLVSRFDRNVHRHGHLTGDSTKVHKFDFIVDTEEENRLAIDAALPDPSSVNAVVVRHLDVRAAKPPKVSQLIVYDDRDNWKSEDLAILRTGGRTFAFTHLPDALTRLM